MSGKTGAQLRDDIKAAEKFFRGMRGKRGSQLSAQERERILAAGRAHADRAVNARRELESRSQSAKAAMRANQSALERIAKRLPGRKAAELRAELDAEQELARLGKRAERDEQLRGAGSYEEVLDASDVATFYAVLGLMAESGSEVFVIPNGRPGRSLRLLRELPGWRASVENLASRAARTD